MRKTGYILFLFFAVIFTIQIQLPISTANAQEPSIPQECLRDAKGKLRKSATALLQSIEACASHDDVQLNAKQLIQAGGLDLVLGLLNDNFQFSELDIARALAEVKSKKVAAALLARYINSDDTPNWRGEEELYFRCEAKNVLEEVLTKVTGVELEQAWTFDQRVTAYKAALKKMKS